MTISPDTGPAAPATVAETLPPPPARIHFVGIGGIGMSGLARILQSWGYVVSGSDAAASDQTALLAASGIPVAIGHGAVEPASRADLVVMTAAVRGENPELSAARAAGVPIVKRAALLGLLANARRGIAVAGSHGKSTTSGMLVTALRALGEDPSYAIGATIAATGTNAAPGRGEAMVVEADEYDYSFLHLRPTLAIVTNVDFDHPDLFPDQAAYDDAFVRFVANIRPDGTLVVAADDPGCARLLSRTDFRPPARVVTVGETPGVDWRLVEAGGERRVAGPGGQSLPLRLAVPGRHNAMNATSALATLVALGHEAAAAAAALESYAGIGRRFEPKGEAAGVAVVDDYAHHPSEIRATLRAAKERYPGRPLWAVFQPHTFSRLKALLPAFGAAFADADRAMILDVYAAREADDLGVGAPDLVALLPPDALTAADPSDAATRLAALLRPGDVVLTLGAGDVTALGPRLLDLLRAGTVGPDTSALPACGPPRDPNRADPSPADASRAHHQTPSPPDANRNNDLPADRDDPQVSARPTARESGAGSASCPDRPRGTPRPRRAAVATVPIPAAPHLTAERDAPMSRHTTWRIGGPADWLVRAATPDDLRTAVAWGVAKGLPVTTIGGGSNLLVGDGGIRGLVILVRTTGARAEALVRVEDLGDAVRLRVGAQAPLSWTGRYAAERGWAGLDWAVGLPGTIGGATVNNAGAHGTEQKDHLESVVLLDSAGRIEERPAAWLEASYRHTRLKAAPRPRALTVVEVAVRLPKGDPAELVRLADEHAAFRRQTQPSGACGGSTFANPPADFAGRLLEEAGAKDLRIGAAAFSPKHANWIVNDGGATAAQVRELIATARARVRDRFGVDLRQEIEEIGDG